MQPKDLEFRFNTWKELMEYYLSDILMLGNFVVAENSRLKTSFLGTWYATIFALKGIHLYN